MADRMAGRQGRNSEDEDENLRRSASLPFPFPFPSSPSREKVRPLTVDSHRAGPFRREQERQRSRRPAGGNEDDELQRAIRESLASDNDADRRRREKEYVLPFLISRGSMNGVGGLTSVLRSCLWQGGGVEEGLGFERDGGGCQEA